MHRLLRYFLLKYFHISTDEDDIDNPDRKPHEELPDKKVKTKAKQDIKDLDAAVKAIKEGKTTYDFVLANYNVKNEEKAILLDASLESSIKNK